MTAVTFSTFAKLTDTTPSPRTYSAEKWVKSLTTHRTRTAKDGTLISPATWHDGYTRGAAGIKELSAVVLDFDAGTIRPEDIKKKLAGYSFWHSTHSNTADSPKWRLFALLSRPVSPDEYRRVHRGVCNLLELTPGSYDRTCAEPSRAYYAPSCPPEHADAAFAGSTDGDLWDVDHLLSLAGEDEPEPRQEPPKQERQHQENTGGRPGEDFNRRGSLLELMTRHGWTHMGDRGGTSLLRKPGATGRDHHATINAKGSGMLYVFSPLCPPFQEGRGYSPFSAYALLEHDGVFTAAAQALARQGYGEPRAQEPPPGREMPPNDSPPSHEGPTEEGEAKRSRNFVSAKELLTRTLVVSYVIDKFIESDCTGELFGPRGGGKTFVALCMALCHATGTPWNGREVKHGIVLYLAGEGHGGVTRRVRAWMKHNGKSADDLQLFHVSRRTVSLDGEGIEDVVAEARDLEALHNTPVVQIVIDTLARHIEGDENATKDMGAFVKAIDYLRSFFPGSVALIVHHTGHSEDARNRSRGSSSLEGAMDFIIKCGDGLLVTTKMKDADIPEPIEFKLTPVVIGTHEDGEPITSCIVEYGQRSERHRASSYTGIEKQAIKALIRVSARYQEKHGDLIGALVGDWREEFYDIRRQSDPDVKVSAMKTAFQRVQESLSAKRALKEAGHARFLTATEHQYEISTLVPPEEQAEHGTKAEHYENVPGIGKGNTEHFPIRECSDVPPYVSPVPETPEMLTEDDFDMEASA